MSTKSDETKQPVFGVAAEPIFDGGPNRDPLVLLPTPGHGDVHDPPIPWHLLTPIEPLPLQEDIMQAAMQLAEPSYPWLWRPQDPLVMQETIVQLAEAICHCEKINDEKINDEKINDDKNNDDKIDDNVKDNDNYDKDNDDKDDDDKDD